MAVNEALRALGDWAIKLRPDTPADVVDAFRSNWFGHIAITAAREDVRVSGDALLRSARYNGVLRGSGRTTDQGYTISGPGMAMWLGDEDGKGAVYETPVSFNAATFTAAVNGLLPPAVTAGTITSPGPATYTQTHQYQDPRTAINYLCDTLNADWRVNGDATLDAGPTSALFVTTPRCAVIARRPGVDGLLRSFPGTSGVDADMNDFSTRVLLVAQSTDVSVATGSADIATGLNPYKDLHSNPLKLTRVVSESDTSSGNATARAQLQLNRFTSTRDALSLSTAAYDVRGDVAVGDYLWVYDEASGLVDYTNDLHFLGERIAPVKLRLFKMSWPVSQGMGVAFRTQAGRWIDLTDYVVFETGATTLTVGGYDRALTSTGNSGISSRIPVPDASIPDQPTWVTPFTQGVYRSGGGTSRAQVQLTWTRPTNTDGSTIVDGDHYEIRYRTSAGSVFSTTWSQAAGSTWNTASGQPWGAPVAYVNGPWQTVFAPFDALSFLLSELTPNLAYQAQIRAVDTATPPNYGAWSSATSFQTVEDTVPPVTPAAPTAVGNTMAVLVTHTLGAASGGTFNLDLDTDHLDVYGAADPTFTPADTNKIGEMPAAVSLIRAHVPSVRSFAVESTAALYIKVVAVDTAGNRSAASDSTAVTPGLIPSQYIQSLTADKITSGTVTAGLVLAGELATSATANQGMHMDALGLRGYRPDGALALRYQNSDGSMYVMGEYRTALTGQRLVMNEGGLVPDAMRIYPNGSGDYARIAGRTAPADGSAAILIDGGAISSVGRGRLGAYKSEAFVSWVASDTSFSSTALSCTSTRINLWTQDSLYLYKASGGSKITGTDVNFFWALGDLANAFCIGTPDSGVSIKFDLGWLLASGSTGSGFANFKCNSVVQTSSGDAKTDIEPIKRKLTPLDVLDLTPAKAWRYRADVAEHGDAAPVRFGPLAEELPDVLVWDSPNADGTGSEKSIELGSMVGVLWGMMRQLRAQRITSTTGTCVVPSGTILKAATTLEVPCVWESTPLATPTDALCFLNAGVLGAGKVTAWVKPGSVTGSGCTVVFKNTSNGAVVAAGTGASGITSITATVVGQGLYTPNIDY